jgi:hypothetical protein
MLPRLGTRFPLEVEFIAQTRESYQSEAHRASGLPPAPAVVIDDEIVLKGPEISEEKLEEAIRRRLRGA